MKTTLEIPEAIFREAKSLAAKQGVPLREFVTEAVKDRIQLHRGSNGKPWMKVAGRLRHLHKETARISKIIEQEFERIEPEDWA